MIMEKGAFKRPFLFECFAKCCPTGSICSAFIRQILSCAVDIDKLLRAMLFKVDYMLCHFNETFIYTKE